MTRVTRLCWPLAAVLLLAGCAVLNPQTPDTPTAPLCAARGIVFAVDGAGGFEAASRTLRQTAMEERLSLEVRSFHWTHGYCRVIADQMHATHLCREGRRLADIVLRCRQESPGQPVYLVGHSAGCGVVLTAAEGLPVGSVERMVLLAPAVSVNHDLRPALACACRGIDVFYSERDWACLRLGVLLTGTTDRRWTLAAGRVGFRVTADGPEDEALFAKLRQYPWDASMTWTGHKGGHYGSYQREFLRTFVLPLLAPGENALAPERALK